MALLKNPIQGEELWKAKHNNWVRHCCYSPDGSTVLSCSYDNTIRMWNLQGKELWQAKHDHVVRYCCYSPDDSTVLSCSDDQTVRMWNNPFCEWSPNNHTLTDNSRKEIIETLFTLRQTGECQLSILPSELMFEICKCI